MEYIPEKPTAIDQLLKAIISKSAERSSYGENINPYVEQKLSKKRFGLDPEKFNARIDEWLKVAASQGEDVANNVIGSAFNPKYRYGNVPTTE